jgi:hypothetical protein
MWCYYVAFRTDLNIVYTLQYIHTNCLRLNQLFHLFYRTRDIAFCCEIGESRRHLQGGSHLTIQYLAHQPVANTGSNFTLRQATKNQRGSRGIALFFP